MKGLPGREVERRPMNRPSPAELLLSLLQQPPEPPRLKTAGRRKGLIAHRLNSFLCDRPEIDPEILQEHAAYFGALCGHAYARQTRRKQEQESWRLRASDNKCVRATGLKRWHKYKTEDKASGTFLMGDILEALTLSWAKLAGARIGNFQREVHVPVPHGLGHCDAKGDPGDTHVVGHIDCDLTVGKKLYVVDVKGWAGFGFKKFKEPLWDDLFATTPQLQNYLLSEEYRDKATGAVILAFNKERFNEWAEKFVPHHQDSGVAAWGERCALVMTCTKDDPPPRPEWATVKRMPRAKCFEIEDPRCRFCDGVQTCFADIGEFELTDKDKRQWRAKIK
jgi:hypothetical protein